MKENETLRPLAQRFEGLDPDVARAAIVELETLRRQPSEDEAARVADLEARLSAAESVAASTTLRSTVAEAFSKAGGRPDALDFIVAKAAGVFAVEGGTLTAKSFSPDRPGERLSLHEFMTQLVKDVSFAFEKSSGGGASGSGGFSGSAGVGIREVVDPTPQQLGQIGAAIKAGTPMRVPLSVSTSILSARYFFILLVITFDNYRTCCKRKNRIFKWK